MYTIGQTDGVAKNNVNAGVPIASIKTYLMEMAKSAADLPEEAKAKADLEILACGEFAAATSSDAAGGTSVNEGTEGEGPLGGEVETSGGGGCPPNMVNGSGSGNSVVKKILKLAATREHKAFIKATGAAQALPTIAAAFQPTQGGVTVPSAPGRPEQVPTGSAANPYAQIIVGPGTASVPTPPTSTPPISRPTPIISTIPEVLDSEIPLIQQQQAETATEFQKKFCAKRPYPECKWCQYASAVMKMNDFDIVDYLQGIRDCLDALNKGNVSWAEQRFVCPGQIAAMLAAEYGPVGALVGRTAAAAVIGSMALHGALGSLRNFATQAEHHDLKHEVASVLTDAIRSGGGGDHYVELLNDIMCTLDVDVRDEFRVQPWEDVPAVFTPTPEAVAAAKSVEPVVSVLLKPEPEASPTVAVRPVTRPVLPPMYKVAPAPEPTKVTYVINTDVIAQVDPDEPSQPKPYHYVAPTGEFKKITPVVGEPLAPYEAEHGPLYVEQDVPQLITETTKAPAPAIEVARHIVEEAVRTGAPVEDLIEEMVETIAVQKPLVEPVINGSEKSMSKELAEYVPPGLNGPTMRAYLDAYHPNLATPEKKEPRVDPEKVNPLIDASREERTEQPTLSPKATDIAYTSPVLPVSGGGGAGSKARYENSLKDERDAGKDPETIIRVARALDALNKIVDPIVLSSGETFEPQVSTNIQDYVNDVVFTPSLVTVSHVPVREMEKLSGIDLNKYELSVAYVLDQDVNHSVMPRDVHATLIPTILDKFPDW